MGTWGLGVSLVRTLNQVLPNIAYHVGDHSVGGRSVSSPAGDVATRSPEPVALHSNITERVAEDLMNVFCCTGVPSEMLSHLGTQFTSDLMNEARRLLSIEG